MTSPCAAMLLISYEEREYFHIIIKQIIRYLIQIKLADDHCNVASVFYQKC